MKNIKVVNNRNQIINASNYDYIYIDKNTSMKILTTRGKFNV